MTTMRIRLDSTAASAKPRTHDPNGIQLTQPIGLREDGSFDPKAPRLPMDGYFAFQCPGCERAGAGMIPLDTRDALEVRWAEDYSRATFLGIRCPSCKMSWSAEAIRTDTPLPGVV